MLFARLTDEFGHGDDVILADTRPKAEYKALVEAGRIRCPDCDAKFDHRSNANDITNPALKCEPIIVDGNPDNVRVPYFTSFALEDHAAGCDYRDDPSIKEHVATFRQALSENKKILIRLNFDLGFEGLRGRFEAASTDGSGLWEVNRWKALYSDYVGVRARDITDVLHYLTVAKALKDKEGMKQLHFLNVDAVQSCERFMVRNLPGKIQRVTREIFNRAAKAHTGQQHMQETPRLFLFEVSPRQQQIAIDERRSKIFGQKYEGIQYVEKNELAFHDVKMGLELKEPSLTNQVVVDRGTRLWVVATPTILDHELKRMNEKSIGIDIVRPDKPAFMMLNVMLRRAFGVVGSERRLSRHAAATLQPLPARQLDLLGDQAQHATTPRRIRTPAARATAAPTRKSPRVA